MNCLFAFWLCVCNPKKLRWFEGVYAALILILAVTLVGRKCGYIESTSEEVHRKNLKTFALLNL